MEVLPAVTVTYQEFILLHISFSQSLDIKKKEGAYTITQRSCSSEEKEHSGLLLIKVLRFMFTSSFPQGNSTDSVGLLLIPLNL